MVTSVAELACGCAGGAGMSANSQAAHCKVSKNFLKAAQMISWQLYDRGLVLFHAFLKAPSQKLQTNE